MQLESIGQFCCRIHRRIDLPSLNSTAHQTPEHTSVQKRRQYGLVRRQVLGSSIIVISCTPPLPFPPVILRLSLDALLAAFWALDLQYWSLEQPGLSIKRVSPLFIVVAPRETTLPASSGTWSAYQAVAATSTPHQGVPAPHRASYHCRRTAEAARDDWSEKRMFRSGGYLNYRFYRDAESPHWNGHYVS